MSPIELARTGWYSPRTHGAQMRSVSRIMRRNASNPINRAIREDAVYERILARAIARAAFGSR